MLFFFKSQHENVRWSAYFQALRNLGSAIQGTQMPLTAKLMKDNSLEKP